MSPTIMNKVFRLRTHDLGYNLTTVPQFAVDPILSVFHRTELASYLGKKI